MGSLIFALFAILTLVGLIEFLSSDKTRFLSLFMHRLAYDDAGNVGDDKPDKDVPDDPEKIMAFLANVNDLISGMEDKYGALESDNNDLKELVNQFKADYSELSEKFTKMTKKVEKYFADINGPGGGSTKVLGYDNDSHQGFSRYFGHVQQAASTSFVGIPEMLSSWVDHHNERYGYNIGHDADGGFLAPKQLIKEIMKVAKEINPIVGMTRKLPYDGKSNTVEVNYLVQSTTGETGMQGGLRIFSKGELKQYEASQQKIGLMEIQLNKFTGFAEASEEVISDSIVTIETMIREGFADALATKFADMVIDGNGSDEFQGILRSKALIEIDPEAGQDPLTIEWQNFSKMKQHIYGRNRRNMLFIVHYDVENAMEEMSFPVGTGGVPVYMPAGGVSVDGYNRLYGRPVLPMDSNPGIGTKGDIIAFDPTQYVMISKGQEFMSSTHFRFDLGQTVFKMQTRAGGQLAWDRALTVRNSNKSLKVGPVAVIKTRS